MNMVLKDLLVIKHVLRQALMNVTLDQLVSRMTTAILPTGTMVSALKLFYVTQPVIGQDMKL